MPRGVQGFVLRYDVQMNAADECAEVMIYGEICQDWWKWSEEDVSAIDFDKALKDAKAKGVKKLNIRINSPGGDVNQAVAMRTMMLNSGMEEINISIEGMCASAATLLACVPGAHVTMSEGSEFMIHNPRSGAWGESKELEAGAKRLRNTESECVAIYARKSGQSEDDIRAWMNAETWMTAREAHERGFVDAVFDAEPIVASVSNRDMEAMRRMYSRVPDSVRACADAATTTGSNGNAARTVAPSVDNFVHEQEEEKNMEIKDITLEQLRAENSALHEQIMQAGAQAERERIQEIDELTPAGEDYAEMAAEAKMNGTSAMQFHKDIVKYQREKGKKFFEQRKEETAASAKVTGSDPAQNDGKSMQQELDEYAKEMADIAKGVYGSDGGMY